MTVGSEKQVAARLSPALRQYLQDQARLGFRSLSSEIAMRLERTRLLDLQPTSSNGAQP